MHLFELIQLDPINVNRYGIVANANIGPNCQNFVPNIVVDSVGPNNHSVLELIEWDLIFTIIAKVHQP